MYLIVKKMSWIVFTLAVLSCFYAASGVNNGALTEFKNYKYVVAIIIDSFTNKWLCTGGIIHPQYILTAAHCFSKPRNKIAQLVGDKEKFQKGTVTVYAGTDSRKVKPTPPGKVAIGLDVYFIKDYFKDLVDDVAILKLDTSLDVGRTFTKLELPIMQNQQYPGSQKIFLTAGYGSDPSNDEKRPQNAGHLKEVVTVIVDNARCNSNPNTQIHGNRQFCAISRNTLSGPLFENGPPFPLGICTGDSGSPIVSAREPLTIKGVVSTVPPGCDSRSYPDVHMNVEAYVDNFINPVLQGTNSIHPSIVKYSFSNSCSL